MPSFDNVAGFPGEQDHLHAFPAEVLGPLLFTAVEPPRHSFAEWIAPVLARVGHLPLDAMRLDASRSRDYLARCHWALYVENYLEGFHIPFVHASLHEAVDEESYAVECAGDCVLQVAEARGGAAAFTPPPGHPDHGRAIAAWYFWMFPNVMLNFYPWGLSLNVVRPLGPDRTKVSFLSFVSDPALLDEGAGSGLDRVEREDEAIVESVQRGARSRFFRQGALSPTREAGVLHFQALLARALGS
jgi:choline monooxygenase